jgi:predicted PhzF superfamily epimerase YddE/YHI9
VAGTVVQECAAGLIEVRRTADGLAFGAPPLVRSGPVDEADLVAIAAQLGIGRDAIVDAAWADNGPGWVAILLASAADVLAVRPGAVTLDIGLVGPYPAGSPAAIELRAFYRQGGFTVEDPVTGSLNASAGGWLIGTGRLAAPYVASQGLALGRAGRVVVTQDPDGRVFVAGRTETVVRGAIEL